MESRVERMQAALEDLRKAFANVHMKMKRANEVLDQVEARTEERIIRLQKSFDGLEEKIYELGEEVRELAIAIKAAPSK